MRARRHTRPSALPPLSLLPWKSPPIHTGNPLTPNLPLNEISICVLKSAPGPSFGDYCPSPANVPPGPRWVLVTEVKGARIPLVLKPTQTDHRWPGVPAPYGWSSRGEHKAGSSAVQVQWVLGVRQHLLPRTDSGVGCVGAAESTGLGVSIRPTGRLEPRRAGQISRAQRPLWSHCETQEKQREGSGTVMSGSGWD